MDLPEDLEIPLAGPTVSMGKRKCPADCMLAYYSHLFPIKEILYWLKYGGSTHYSLARREFAVEGPERRGGKPFYRRYVRIEDVGGFQSLLGSDGISNIHLGAVYSEGLSREAINRKECLPVYRELVFDVDMDDLPLASVGLIPALDMGDSDLFQGHSCLFKIHAWVISDVLKNAFGFSCVFCVYSGNRGMHVWCGDEKAMRLCDNARASIASYIQIDWTKARDFRALGKLLEHPHFDHVYRTFVSVDRDGVYDIHPVFAKMVSRFSVFDKAALSSEAFVHLIPDEWLHGAQFGAGLTAMLDTPSLLDIIEAVRECTAMSTAGRFTWETFERGVFKAFTAKALELTKAKGGSSKVRILLNSASRERAQLLCMASFLRLCYPVLDAKVTGQVNHLLRLPFTVSSKSKCISVPVESFDLSNEEPLPLFPVSEVVDDARYFQMYVYAWNSWFVHGEHVAEYSSSPKAAK
jgi:DNA primase small subunit